MFFKLKTYSCQFISAHLSSPRFHTHIGSLWSATAWWGIWIINEKPSHLVVTVDPVSTLMLMSLQRELAGTNMCWPVFVPQITAKMVTLIMMKIHSCYVMPFLSYIVTFAPSGKSFKKAWNHHNHQINHLVASFPPGLKLRECLSDNLQSSCHPPTQTLTISVRSSIFKSSLLSM